MLFTGSVDERGRLLERGVDVIPFKFVELRVNRLGRLIRVPLRLRAVDRKERRDAEENENRGARGHNDRTAPALLQLKRFDAPRARRLQRRIELHLRVFREHLGRRHEIRQFIDVVERFRSARKFFCFAL